jgi:hypothetical protein
VAGVSDEPYCQLIPLSEVAVQARHSIGWNSAHFTYVAWWVGMATPLSGLS